MFIEQHIIEEELYKAKHQVTISNQELQDKNNQLKVLASDIIAIQERERKKLSQELHDEAAQNITALQVGIKLNEKKGSVTFQSHLSIIKNQAAEIYQKVYELVHWLRPRIVDEVGLVATLQSTYFADRLARANITYDAHIILDESALSIELKIAIFRLIQEATLLAMENRSVTKFCVHLSQHQDKIKLVISDDREQAYTSTNTPIFDPFKIEYQVLALAGSLSIELELGMRLQILLPMHTSADHLGEGA
nr:histidine kinase [Opacimonas viscosa]